MKKFILIFFSSLIFNNFSYASIIEFGKCYGSYKEELWNEENYNIAKNFYRKYEEKPYLKDGKWIFEDFHTGHDLVDDLNEDEETIKYVNEIIENYKNIKVHDKYIVSINTANSTVTILEEYTNERIDSLYLYYRTLAQLIKKGGGSEAQKNSAKNPYVPEKTTIEKYSISDYVGGIILAFNERGYGVKIDLNTLNINYGSRDKPNFQNPYFRWVCTENFNNQIADEGSKNKSSSGTAFFVSNKGYLLTNHHVVEGCSVSKITYNNKDYDTELIATDVNLDLALLKSQANNKSFINFSNKDLKKMQRIYVGGYPLGKGLSDDLKISSGIVSSLKGFNDNSNEIQIDAAINPGNSGGPIINQSGELVAIAVAGLSKDVTEGINFGIKASAAEMFLKSNKLKPSYSRFTKEKKNDQLLEILEESTVYTYCD